MKILKIINSFEDLYIYLDIYRYWMLDEDFHEIFYCSKNGHLNCLKYAYENGTHVPVQPSFFNGVLV